VLSMFMVLIAHMIYLYTQAPGLNKGYTFEV
jgi:hypothetical protein